MSDLQAIEKARRALAIRLDGHEYALGESVPTLVGAYLARRGVLDIADLDKDLRDDVDNPRIRDATDLMFMTLADLVFCYRRDGADTARYCQVVEKVG